VTLAIVPGSRPTQKLSPPGPASAWETVPGQPVDATPAAFKCFLQKDVFSDLWERYSTYSHVESDLMRCFESRALVREIGCALGKARNVFHLKEVLH